MANEERDLGRTPHVLVIEDDPGVRSAMQMLLELDGFKVSTATTLAECLPLVEVNRDISILIVDFHLRDGQLGTDVVQSIRATLGSTIDAVLITGDTSGAADAMARDAHIQMVRKPIKPAELLGILQGFLVDGV
jgi:DNA-binding response OmpR family regulator